MASFVFLDSGIGLRQLPEKGWSLVSFYRKKWTTFSLCISHRGMSACGHICNTTMFVRLAVLGTQSPELEKFAIGQANALLRVFPNAQNMIFSIH